MLPLSILVLCDVLVVSIQTAHTAHEKQTKYLIVKSNLIVYTVRKMLFFGDNFVFVFFRAFVCLCYYYTYYIYYIILFILFYIVYSTVYFYVIVC